MLNTLAGFTKVELPDDIANRDVLLLLLSFSSSGLPCDVGTSTCNGNNHLCHGRGPAYPDDTKSTQIIGQRQADAAQASSRRQRTEHSLKVTRVPAFPR
jgi:hypothetical protein